MKAFKPTDCFFWYYTAAITSAKILMFMSSGHLLYTGHGKGNVIGRETTQHDNANMAADVVHSDCIRTIHMHVYLTFMKVFFFNVEPTHYVFML